jgi:hypothetical protein
MKSYAEKFPADSGLGEHGWIAADFDYDKYGSREEGLRFPLTTPMASTFIRCLASLSG